MLKELFDGAVTTILLFMIGWGIGFPCGLAFALLSISFDEVRYLVRSGSIFLSVVPLLALLFWFHYPLQAILGVVIPPFATAAGLISLYIIFSVADILGRELAWNKGQLGDVAQVLGIPLSVFLRQVVLRASLERSLPRLLTLAIASIHLTMFASLIGVEELFRASQHLNASILRPVQIFSLMAAIYALLCLPLFVLSRRVQYSLRGRESDA